MKAKVWKFIVGLIFLIIAAVGLLVYVFINKLCIMMKKPYSKEQHESMRKSRNFQRGNTAEQRKALVQALLVKEAKDRANKAADILKEAFSKDCNLTKEGRHKYHITRKDVVVQLTGHPLIPIEGKTVLGEGQMIMEVNSQGYLKIFLTTIDGDRAYTGSNLSNDDLESELPALKAFVLDGTALPSTSKFVGQTYVVDFYDDQDLEEIIQGYNEDLEGSKPK